MKSIRSSGSAWLLGASVAASLAAAGCAAERPPAADQLGELTPPTAAIADAGVAGEACEPRTKRECIQTFRSSAGLVLVCRDSVEYCRADGTGWHECGVMGTGPNGETLPPD